MKGKRVEDRKAFSNVVMIYPPEKAPEDVVLLREIRDALKKS